MTDEPRPDDDEAAEDDAQRDGAQPQDPARVPTQPGGEPKPDPAEQHAQLQKMDEQGRPAGFERK